VFSNRLPKLSSRNVRALLESTSGARRGLNIQIVKESYSKMRKSNCWDIPIVRQCGRFKRAASAPQCSAIRASGSGGAQFDERAGTGQISTRIPFRHSMNHLKKPIALVHGFRDGARAPLLLINTTSGPVQALEDKLNHSARVNRLEQLFLFLATKKWIDALRAFLAEQRHNFWIVNPLNTTLLV
jgi:hypothetical protein